MTARQAPRVLSALMLVATIVLLLGAPGARSSSDEGPPPQPRVLAEGMGGIDVLAGRTLEINGEVKAVPVDQIRGARPAGLLDDVLESQDFEGTTFPPDGWAAFDDIARQGGGDEKYVWAIQDIETPRDGGLQAAWSIGGGTIGSTIGFGGFYTDSVASVLTYGPIDLSDYPDGLTVQHRFYPDLPVRTGAAGVPEQAKAFLVCTERRDNPNNLDCRTLADEDQPRKQWVGWQEPLAFTLAGGLDEVNVYFVHRDGFPTGSHMGVIIDNVEIVAKTTSDPGPGPTVAPSPEPTPGGPGPGPGPGPDPLRAYLPMVFKNFDKADFPVDLPKPEPGGIEVHFGTAVDRATGALTNEGVEFDYGVQALCARQQWQGLDSGTQVRVQWYVEDGDEYVEIDPTNASGINPTFEVEGPAGFSFQCIGYADGGGNAVPVPVGRYRNSAFLRGEDVASGSRTVSVVPGSGPPTATPDPGNPPTAVPTVTPPGEATPKPTLPANCTDPLVNGDFEQGPSVGWQQQSNGNRASILPEGALESSYGVLFGRAPGAQEAVMALEPVTTFAPGELESATVRWWFRVVSDETRGNGDNADNFIIGVRGNTADDVRSLVGISEDSAAPGTSSPFPSDRWFALQADIATGFAAGEGFDEAHLVLVGLMNENNQLTNFRADNVILELCTPEGQSLAPLRAVPPTSADKVAAAKLLELARRAPMNGTNLRVIGQRPVSDGLADGLLRLDPRGLLRANPIGGQR